MKFVFWRFGILAVVVSTFGLNSFACAQVNGTGPSDAVLFDEVVNVSNSTISSLPEVPNGQTLQVSVVQGGTVNASLVLLGGGVRSGVEVNVDGGRFTGEVGSGGEVNIISGTGASFTVNSGGQANIFGGTSGVRAFAGSDVNISGGNFGVTAGSGSSVRVRGGSLQSLQIINTTESDDAADVVLSGGEFVLNGNPISEAIVEFDERDVLTGTLEDGSAFSLGPFSIPGVSTFATNFQGPGNRIRLDAAPLPPVRLAPIAVNTMNPDIPSGLRVGQTLTLQAGGRLRNDFHAIGSTLNIEAGSLGERAIANGGTVNVSGGIVERSLTVLGEAVVNVTGGEVVGGISVDRGSRANISGGGVGGFSALEGSEAVISGGVIAAAGLSAGTTELVGGEFKLNGNDFDGATITLGSDDELTGTLADGSPFIFRSELTPLGRAAIAETTLSRVMLPEIDTTPIVVAAVSPGFSLGLRVGQELTLAEGGELGQFIRVVDARLNVEGGQLGFNGQASRSEVNISGGIVHGYFFAGAGSEVNISGGEVDQSFTALADSVVNISGGEIATPFFANADSEVNLVGTEFFLDGVLISFVDDEPITIEDRDVTLAGTLLDGTIFEFELNTPNGFVMSSFSPQATVTVSLAAAESSVLLGDVTVDGTVDFLDIAPFIAVLASGGFQSEADTNVDGNVDFLDISPFIGLLSN